MPLQATSGAASYDAFGGGVAAVPNYIEDVFSTWLYTGNGSTQTINNGIDLAGKGGLIWVKNRGTTALHTLSDTARGANFTLHSSLTDPESFAGGINMSFLSSGWSVSNNFDTFNQTSNNYVSWTFREQPKFFDVVTWTGNGVNGRQISHALGAVPGCIIVKNTSNTAQWAVYHRSNHAGGSDPQNYGLYLNTTNATFGAGFWNNTAPTSTAFTVANDSRVNTSGNTYVAYLFAHNAGGFGLTGTDNVISCGSFTTDGSGNATVNLGYEPQFALVKGSSFASIWAISDVMRGMTANTGVTGVALRANATDAEGPSAIVPFVSSTGFFMSGAPASSTYIYIAIRRGPMRTPTTGTSVFDVTTAGTNTNISLSGRDFDAYIGKFRSGTDNGSGIASTEIIDRLRGLGVYTSWAAGNTSPSPALRMASTAAEASTSNMGIVPSSVSGTGNLFLVTRNSSDSNVLYGYRRAPGFFDEVCDTGTGSVRTVAHNLGVAPEFIIRKMRGGVAGWYCYHSALGNTDAIRINSTSATASDVGYWNNTTPTSTQFTVGTSGDTNQNTATFVTYLFASCPGVSKVGSYTGNGSSQTINMGFTGGARFFLVKRTDSTGDWWVYDSARGIVSAADPALRLNSTAAEVTSADAVDTDSTGLIVNQESTCNINVSSATYIYLGIS